MIDLSDCLVLGTISKTHGVHGKVVARLNNLSFDDILKMEPVYLEIEGLPVPFFVNSWAEKTQDSIIVEFDDVNTADEASEFLHARIYVPASCLNISDGMLRQLRHLSGYTVTDVQAGELGTLEEILTPDENPLLRILSAHREVLLPFHDDFIVSVDPTKKIILVKAPEGLLDLN